MARMPSLPEAVARMTADHAKARGKNPPQKVAVKRDLRDVQRIQKLRAIHTNKKGGTR